MRLPTPPETALRWHRLTLEAKATGTKAPPIHEAEPQCGFFIRRLVKDGPYVPCRIFLESPTDPETGELTGPELLRCEIDGIRKPPDQQWQWLAGRPISEDEYFDMIAARMAARARAVTTAPAALLNQGAKPPGADMEQQNSPPVGDEPKPQEPDPKTDAETFW